jgi:hypothetical protein
MKRKRFSKLVMAEGCDKRTAELFADFAVMVYGSYSTAYSNKGFQYICGLSNRTKECASSGELIPVELLSEVIAFRHGLTTILGCGCCICCDTCTKDKDKDKDKDTYCLDNITEYLCTEMIEVIEFSPVDNLPFSEEDATICKGEIEVPISKEKMDSCYIPNGETYPLCKGQLGNTECKDCNLYEDMSWSYDED